MRVELPKIVQRIERIRRAYRYSSAESSPDSSAADEQPLRAELFNIEQLENYAKQLAESHEITKGRAADRLLARLDENEEVLNSTHELVSAAVKNERRVSPAAEWLLDNFYVIEEQIRTARRHLPRSYSRELPQLSNTSAAGYPRVYGIALELIAHVDGGLDLNSLTAFIAAYQTVQPLTLGELWAVPIMLRLALIENLRRVAAALAASRRDRDSANEWAAKMSAVVERSPSDLIIVLADMARENPPLTSAFLAELTRHLHGQSPHFAFAQSWLEHRLSEQGLRLGPLIQKESQIQAADQVSIGNSITSLRILSSNDWRDFVEGQSVVEKVLHTDPDGTYPKMDFSTRDRYRHAVELIAKRSGLTEKDVAAKAIAMANDPTSNGSDNRIRHVGYYLIDKGRPTLERITRMRLSPRILLSKLVHRFPLSFYLVGITLVTLAIMVPVVDFVFHHGLGGWLLAAFLLPLLMCVVHLSIAVVNWVVTLCVGPQSLPRMDYQNGIAGECRTAVAIPTMLTSISGIDDLIDGIELRYLANTDDHLHFALLTDLSDAKEETLPEDAKLIQHARAGISALKEKYEHNRQGIFFLFHRPRRWNERDKIWMGYERKRGKLAEFNTFLRSRSTERFSDVVGDLPFLKDVCYVITLDTDTQLPRDSARQMVGAMAHPLNRPVFDPKSCRVIEGYGIMQPRVGVSLPSASRSWYVRLFAADAGLDPYTRVVSDVYQDLFREGSFIGKGIYDIAAFDKACSGFPDNAILSHDLLESAYARSALLSDVELYEDHPSRHAADVSRRRRWTRGDWQIFWWLFPRVPGSNDKWTSNSISGLSKWKIFDNLRRSLIPPATITVLLFGWLAYPSLAGATTVLVVAMLAAMPLVTTVTGLFRKAGELPWMTHFQAVVEPVIRHIGQIIFAIAFLPYDAAVSIHAIAVTVSRMLLTRRDLLEWQTSSEAERAARSDLPGTVRSMLAEPAFAVAMFSFAIARHYPLTPQLPFLTLWILAPVFSWFLSRSLPPARARLSESESIFLQKLARRTWRYFETFVTAGENWLPPDNVQEVPSLVIASRTSPTNIGMALLADLSAYDFGYCSAGEFLHRTNNTMITMGRLERFRTHFYNWYDTRTLRPLPPLYVSTVDSGNLAGHMIVMRQGLLELINEPICSPRIFAGLRDTCRVLQEAAHEHKSSRSDQTSSRLEKLDRLLRDLEKKPQTVKEMDDLLQRCAKRVADIAALAGPNNEFKWWADALERTIIDHRNEFQRFAPWLQLPTAPTGGGMLESMRKIAEQFEGAPTLKQIAGFPVSLMPLIDDLLAKPSHELPTDAQVWLTAVRVASNESSTHAAERIRLINDTAERCREFAEMDFTFLYDKSRDLMSIGYRVNEHRLDAGFYDLLASESRLGSFVAIAQGQVSQKHWFSLGRLLTVSGGTNALLSWSGSMFEYLMPLLVMPTYENTLLDQTYKGAVQRQISYGKQRGVPWGISESGYNATDAQMNYQYRAFGVPGMGLKRGLAEDLVIAPYATVMSLMVSPRAACQNLQRLTSEGRQGAYGFYEAIDYTPSRVPPEETSVTIRSFMVHHEGMSLLALLYVLRGQPMQRRFDADPMLRATDLLLQERVPRTVGPVFPHASEASTTRSATPEQQGLMRIYSDPNTPIPEVHLLSNGRYHVMVSSAGGGYSRWLDLAVTRWREDATRDCWGTFCYLREADQEEFWSASFQPTLTTAKGYEAIFTQGRAEFRRRDRAIESHTEISVSPEDDIELRRITLTNRSDEPRDIEVTSFAEVILAPLSQDLAHPAFSNLFVQTELVRNRHAILATRRARSASEKPPWLVHLIAVEGTAIRETGFETDRMKFIGRGRTTAFPAAMDAKSRLTDSEGPVLDPIVSISRTIRIGAGESARVDIVTGMAETREGAVALMEKYHDARLADRVFELAWTHSNVALRQLNITEVEAQLFGRLAGSMIYATAHRRANASILVRNRRGQSGLWGYGISGDLPIMLVRIRDRANLDIVRQSVLAHAYWRTRGLNVDLVIWNEDDSVYRQSLQETIMDIFIGGPEAGMVDKPGGVFLRRGEQLPEEDRVLLQTAARVVLYDNGGTFREQVERRSRIELAIPAFKPLRVRPEPPTATELPQRDLTFFNGLGGFTRDGREYVTILHPNKNTPAPWSNVIANVQFGTVVSESGSIYTWSENSHEFRLTPWHNDPVGGGGGEAFYIRDEESGRFWSPSPLPARGPMAYVSRHGFGYSIFEYEDDGISCELILYVAVNAPVKFARFKISNRSGRSRRVSLTAFWELVLGELRNKTLMHIVTEIDPVTNAVLARNPHNSEFADRVVFVDCTEANRTFSGDRAEFIGRNGTLANPASMRRSRLSGRVGAAFDPCAAMQVMLQLENGQMKELAFILGSAQSEEQARQLIRQHRGMGGAHRALEGVWHYWSRSLGVVYFETPDPAVNVLANGWLVYQTLACRMWARTGFYQSGGAYGFRDQLQDAMALVHAEPLILREHILRAAARQFREGDVQHWWHPPQGRGVRTHFSDDFLWLPYAVARYVSATGDTGVFSERLPFLDSRALRPEEESFYDLPHPSNETGTLYEHCSRAINHGLRFGAHGLPLMGCGDWNDGMNLIGEHGKGESVWLAFFLYDVMTRFIPHARQQGDTLFAEKCMTETAAIRQRIEENAWDGQWYRRAYFDDGTPLGSAQNAECQIDSLPQTWAILSGAGDPERSALAMSHVNQRLVEREDGLIKLFDPPFDKSNLEPGYIKGYLPGVRENGGQYTHAAVWTVMAYAATANAELAWELFNLINPVHHGESEEKIKTYKVEPYVMAADVYGVSPHIGRGGWTWYTGSAGWMYRLISESLLGLQLQIDRLTFTPCIPADWKSYRIHYRYRETFYHITINNPSAGKVVMRVAADGVDQADKSVHLVDDRAQHEVQVELG